MKRKPSVLAVDYWFTTREWGCDQRTSTIAIIWERRRLVNDRPGKEDTVWQWHVLRSGQTGAYLAYGVAQNQKGARRAAREFIRTLPDKET